MLFIFINHSQTRSLSSWFGAQFLGNVFHLVQAMGSWPIQLPGRPQGRLETVMISAWGHTGTLLVVMDLPGQEFIIILLVSWLLPSPSNFLRVGGVNTKPRLSYQLFKIVFFIVCVFDLSISTVELDFEQVPLLPSSVSHNSEDFRRSLSELRSSSWMSWVSGSRFWLLEPKASETPKGWAARSESSVCPPFQRLLSRRVTRGWGIRILCPDKSYPWSEIRRWN